jgi:hypothetical protein
VWWGNGHASSAFSGMLASFRDAFVRRPVSRRRARHSDGVPTARSHRRIRRPGRPFVGFHSHSTGICRPRGPEARTGPSVIGRNAVRIVSSVVETRIRVALPMVGPARFRNVHPDDRWRRRRGWVALLRDAHGGSRDFLEHSGSGVGHGKDERKGGKPGPAGVPQVPLAIGAGEDVDGAVPVVPPRRRQDRGARSPAPRCRLGVGSGSRGNLPSASRRGDGLRREEDRRVLVRPRRSLVGQGKTVHSWRRSRPGADLRLAVAESAHTLTRLPRADPARRRANARSKAGILYPKRCRLTTRHKTRSERSEYSGRQGGLTPRGAAQLFPGRQGRASWHSGSVCVLVLSW